MVKKILMSLTFVPLAVLAVTSEISVDLKLDNTGFVAGERIRGVVQVINSSPYGLAVGTRRAPDRFFVEVFRSKDNSQLESISDRAFVAPFALESCKTMKLETFLGDHYGLRNAGHYFAKPVLVHDGMRYEGQIRAFDVVPGMKIGGALQMFANHDGLQREFELMTWNRGGEEHLFISARDEDVRPGRKPRTWRTTDLGPMMKVTKPTISVMQDGRVIVLHRLDPDNFLRSEFWSVPNEISFERRELVQDPETAGTARVREIYKESGGITPKENPWWKFW